MVEPGYSAVRLAPALERECVRLGAVDYIKKPWGPSELEERIGMVLGYPNLSVPRVFRTRRVHLEDQKNDTKDAS